MACTRAGMEPVEFLWNNDPVELSELDGYIIVGDSPMKTDQGLVSLLHWTLL